LLTKSAKRRIVIASLYVGNGELEHKLVGVQSVDARTMLQIDNLTTSVRNGVDVTVLLDYARGTRGPNSSCDVLKQFVNNGGKVGVEMNLSSKTKLPLSCICTTAWLCAALSAGYCRHGGMKLSAYIT
jgi:hypothetical protein